LSQREPSYHGDFYDFDSMVVEPCSVQERVPLWVGGRTLRSLRRSAALGDGWSPFAVKPAQARDWLDQVQLPPNFEVVLPPAGRLDPVNEPGSTREILSATADAGATIMSVTRACDTLDEYLDFLAALAEVRLGTDGVKPQTAP
jgi:Luciferase-like monooxygenase